MLGPAGAPPTTPVAWPPAAAVAETVDDAYPELAALGYDYGPAFRGLRARWRHGADRYAEISLPAELRAEAARYALHPALLDAALHALVLDRAPGDAGHLINLPFVWAGVQVHTTGATDLRVRITGTDGDATTLELAEVTGRPVASVRALTLRAVPADRLTADAGVGCTFWSGPSWRPGRGRPVVGGDHRRARGGAERAVRRGAPRRRRSRSAGTVRDHGAGTTARAGLVGRSGAARCPAGRRHPARRVHRAR